jgi:hypothetical protein
MMGRSHQQAIKVCAAIRDYTSAIQVLLDDCHLSDTVTIDEYDEHYLQELKRLFPMCQLLPGAETLVQTFRM